MFFTFKFLFVDSPVFKSIENQFKQDIKEGEVIKNKSSKGIVYYKGLFKGEEKVIFEKFKYFTQELKIIESIAKKII